jgi:chromosome segregation ATPase
MVLTLVEDYGGYINQLCGGKLVLGGYEIIPIVTLVASVIVGIISNGFTKEQNEKIKALFSKSSTDELIQAEIKKTIKERSATLSQYNKILSTKEAELENLQSELETRENSYNAKKGMYTMTPQLATEEDVKLALNAVHETTEKIENKKVEIEECKETISNLTTTINALKSQL